MYDKLIIKNKGTVFCHLFLVGRNQLNSKENGAAKCSELYKIS